MNYKIVDNRHLKEFLQYSENLTDLYHVNRNDFDEKWIDIKSSIANSIISLYKFSNQLFKSEKFKDKEIRHYAFYLDLILSKLRHSLFTETPKKSFVDIHTYTSEDIANIGQILFDKEEVDEEFDIDFHRFIFKIFLMYDFIFYEESGVFTRFDLNKSLYEKISGEVLNFESEEDSFRDYGKNIVENILKKTIDSDEKSIYEKYIETSKKETVLIEPFSYYLGFKIWKMAKIIQSTLEFANISDQQNQKDVFKKYFKNSYLSKSKEVIQNFYDGKITNRELFSSFAKLDKDILQKYILKSLLPLYTNKEVLLENFGYKTINIDSKHIDINNLINKMISNTQHDRFKFYRVLEDKETSIEELSVLIETLGNKISNKDNIEIIGMLRSGVLLAHCINISQNINKSVYMFSSFPYISILPRTNLSKNQDVIIIDESIKSAFSAILANNYKQRAMHINGCSIYHYNSSVYTLVDFVDFEKDNIEASYNSLAKVKSVNGDILLDESEHFEKLEKREIFDWKSYIDSLHSPSIDFDDITVEIDGIKRIDITRILSNSHLLFGISKKFAKHLSTVEDEKIILFASTDEGKLLVDSTIFVYKVLYPDNKKIFILNKSNAKEQLKTDTKLIFVDMSIDTMHTLERSLDIDFSVGIDSIYYAYTILISDESKKKLKDKIIFIDELHKGNSDA